MTDEEVVKLLAYIRDTIEDDLKYWNDKVSNSYFAYGPSHADALKDLEKLLNHFESHAKFEKNLSEAYSSSWPDFVDGNIA